MPLLYCRPSPLQTFPRKVCNIANLPPEDLQHCRPSPGRSATLQTFPQGGKVGNIADLPPFMRGWTGGVGLSPLPPPYLPLPPPRLPPPFWSGARFARAKISSFSLPPFLPPLSLLPPPLLPPPAPSSPSSLPLLPPHLPPPSYPVRPLLHCRSSPGEGLQHCRPSPIFKVPDSHCRMYWKTLFGYYIKLYRLFKYVTINDKTIIFSYVFSFSIKLPQEIWICKDKTYNGRNDMVGSSAMGEGLQWFFSTIADLPGGEVCNWGEGLQYNTPGGNKVQNLLFLV